MKKPLFFLISLYSIFFTMFVFVIIGILNKKLYMDNIQYIFTLILINFLIVIAVGIINILFSRRLFLQKDELKLITILKILKFGSIPFFVIFFILSVIFLAVSHGFGFLIAPFLILFAYFVLIVSSCFGLAYIGLLKKNRIISRTTKMVYQLMLICFVLDIICTIVISQKKISNI